MSEVGWYSSNIKFSKVKVPTSKVESHSANIENHPNYEILKKSMEMISKEQGGNLVNHVKDFSGNETICDLAINTPEFPRGVGIKINRDTGQTNFLFDDYGERGIYAKKITDLITQTYTSIAIIRAMKDRGFRVNEGTSEDKSTVVLMGSAAIKKIIAEVTIEGEIKLEFSGFPGNECEAERIKLMEPLIGFGLEIKQKSIVKKKEDINSKNISNLKVDKIKSNSN